MYLLLEFITDILEDDLKWGYTHDSQWNFLLTSIIHNSDLPIPFQKVRFVAKLTKMYRIWRKLFLSNDDHLKQLLHRCIRLVSNI